jgi:hypothetical protein
MQIQERVREFVILDQEEAARGKRPHGAGEIIRGQEEFSVEGSRWRKFRDNPSSVMPQMTGGGVNRDDWTRQGYGRGKAG